MAFRKNKNYSKLVLDEMTNLGKISIMENRIWGIFMRPGSWPKISLQDFTTYFR